MLLDLILKIRHVPPLKARRGLEKEALLKEFLCKA